MNINFKKKQIILQSKKIMNFRQIIYKNNETEKHYKINFVRNNLRIQKMIKTKEFVKK